MDAQALLLEAERLALAGEIARAQEICYDVLRQHPEQAEALYLLGMLQSHAGNIDGAIALLDRAVAANPKFELAYASRGALLLQRGWIDAAIDNLKTAVTLDPKFAEAQEALAGALRRAGRTTEAVDAWARATQLRPESGEAMHQFALALMRAGRIEDAAAAWAAAIQLFPRRADLHTHRAFALYQLGRSGEGLAAAERAAQIEPAHLPAHRAIVQGLFNERRIEDALAGLDRMIALKPDDADAHFDRGSTLIMLGELDAADAALKTAIQLRPDAATFASKLLKLRNYIPGYDADALYREHADWAARYARPATAPSPRAAAAPDADRPLRIGFVSPDFRLHPIGYFMQAFFAHHDRGHFHFTAYSDLAVESDFTRELRAMVDLWRPIGGQSDDDVEHLIRADNIDILIDLTGHAGEHRLLVFARRPAPVQVSYLGYCNTTGMKAIDYIIGDAVTDPPDRQQSYAETLLRVPGTFACYTPPHDAPPVAPLPALARNGGVITFGSLHALAKLNEAVIALWSRVLDATPRSRMLLFRDALSTRARRRLTDMFARHRIDAARLEFRNTLPPSGDSMSTYDDIDISLDAFPWSGHTTACESMWMGVPMVTLRGSTHAGRMAASAVTHAGNPQWVAEDADQFVMIATDLARDVDALSRLRQPLREQMQKSRLCDGKAFTGDFEDLLRRIAIAKVP